jgi:hypothetical protein
VRFRDGGLITIAFVPKGVKIPPPPAAVLDNLAKVATATPATTPSTTPAVTTPPTTTAPTTAPATTPTTKK